MSADKNTAQKKLVAASANAAPPVQKSSSEFVRKMLFFPDAKIAAELVAEQTGIEFDIGDGKDMPRLEMEKAALDVEYGISEDVKTSLESTRKNTPRYKKSPNAETSVPFSSWEKRDQYSVYLLVPFLLTMLSMGAVNVDTNLVSSGEPVFIDHPWMAWCLSALLPAASTAIKFISSYFYHAASKKRYALFIYVLTAIAIAGWAVSFSFNFTGVTGALDWDALGHDDASKGTSFVLLQIACEMLTGAALFLALDEVSQKYNPDLLKDNPDYLEIEKALKKHEAEQEKLGQRRNQVHAELVRLKKARQEYINNHLADFYALMASRSI